jgi:pimeloyl-ACP methyl ester carboxylesterase
MRGGDHTPPVEHAYDKKTQDQDMGQILDALKVGFVIHDVGKMVGCAFACQYPDRVKRWVVMDDPLPGFGHWDEIIRSPALWHCNFRGPVLAVADPGRP